MTCHYQDLDSASGWSWRVGNLIQPIKSTTQIWIVTRHQYRISALVSQTSFGGETSGCVAKCQLFSQANSKTTLKVFLRTVFFLKTHLNLPFAMKKNCQEIHKYNETSGTGIKFQCFRLRFNLVCNNTNFLIEFLKSTSLQFAVMLKTRRTLHLYRERLKGEL